MSSGHNTGKKNKVLRIVEKALAKAEQKLKQQEQNQAYELLTGLSSKDATLEDIRKALRPDPNTTPAQQERAQKKIEKNKAKIEKGSGENRSFTQELEEMVYNVGMEYWYTDAFALRAGYIYDFEGKIFNPTFGAGIRLLQYGFDFGYTAGEQGHPRANTMFFSVNIKL